MFGIIASIVAVTAFVISVRSPYFAAQRVATPIAYSAGFAASLFLAMGA
ncbi:hypothetical protein EniLVp02_0214 [Vibrio phage EniLVp02]